MLTDIHHHLIWGVDDGAQTLEDAQAMLRQAAQEGIHRIVGSSHITPGYHSFPVERYLRHLEALRAWIDREGLGIQLESGSEILYTDATPSLLRSGQVPTLANTSNVLVEFTPDVPLDRVERAAREIGNAGFGVVFAHVERYDCLHHGDALPSLKRDYLVRAQMNASTILKSGGLFGDHWAKTALRSGWIDIAASDAHNVSSRICRLGECHRFLIKHYGQEFADRLCIQQPEAVLRRETGT